MTIMKMSLPRRTFLRGAGATVALPLLDAMVPASTALAKTAAAPFPRVGFIYQSNGQCLQSWIPDAAGSDFQFNTTMKPVEEYRKHLTIVSGTSNLSAIVPGETAGPHTRSAAVWLGGI
jgi:hypothetical protein